MPIGIIEIISSINPVNLSNEIIALSSDIEYTMSSSFNVDKNSFSNEWGEVFGDPRQDPASQHHAEYQGRELSAEKTNENRSVSKDRKGGLIRQG